MKMLDEIKKRLNTQDNRITADPIFVVYDWDRIPTSSDYSDYFMFVDDEGQIADTQEEFIDFLKENDFKLPFTDELKEMSTDRLLDWLCEEQGYEHFRKVYYIKKRTFINVFFTEESANDFIKQNHYHYSKEVHIYVNCLWRNPEMQFIRNSLKDGKFTFH